MNIVPPVPVTAPIGGFWYCLDGAEQEALAAGGQERAFQPGTRLCFQDEVATDVIVIKSGWTKVSVRIGRHERIIVLRGPGDLVGEWAVVTESARSATVVAVDTVSALVIRAERFRAVL